MTLHYSTNSFLISRPANQKELGTILPSTRIAPRPCANRQRRRQISPSTGKALEILGHAIEYLADEVAHEAGTLGLLEPEDPRFESIQILMAANRTLYYGCPVVPDFRDRISDFWSRRMSSFWFGGIAKLLIRAESE
jgi:hypothetical protein